ncbi:ATPase, T2SS/T4P/T4SS family [Azospirillum argentinense]|uniref:Uncharacterized protein n=1 Tax=Azospirillum brasilense TaxID=192 RepID=A0A4D8PY51_AZOBR|nr:ATPase, T2SS/T4P/T4SS family [Azospirillum argentinense]QCO02847.1 hypothetical protein D3867_13005 [Azospirillum argentinense]
MTELVVIDEPARHEMLLLALRRLMDGLFGDLLSREDVANVLVLPPMRGQGTCRVLVKNGPSPEFVRDANPDQVRRFLAYIAGFQRKELRRDRPTLDVTLPETGERIHADIEPVTTGPACSIRKPYRGRITLDDWVASGAATPLQARILRRLIDGRRTVVIAGDVDTGKTTLLRACLEEPAFMSGLPAVLQDPYEFEPPCPHAYAMVADPWADPPVTLETLVANALRVPMTHLVTIQVLVLLADPNAAKRSILRDWGLNATQAAQVARAMSRRDLFFKTPEGNRLGQLTLDPAALAVCGCGGAAHKRRAFELMANAGPQRFAAEWLRRNGLTEAADTLETIHEGGTP